jgi:hypothetical protein
MDPQTGPMTKSFYSSLIFGNNYGSNLKHVGFFGKEFCDSEMFHHDIYNSYQWDFCEYNNGSNVVTDYGNIHKSLHTECIWPLQKELYKIASEHSNGIRQVELGKCLGIPQTLRSDGQQKDRMIAELVTRMEEKGIITTKLVSNKKFIYANNMVYDVPETYSLVRNNKSKLEAKVKNIIHDAIHGSDISCKWGVRIVSIQRAPYDFGLFNGSDLLALIEVDGDQHYNRNNYIYNRYDMFDSI